MDEWFSQLVIRRLEVEDTSRKKYEVRGLEILRMEYYLQGSMWGRKSRSRLSMRRASVIPSTSASRQCWM